MKVIISTRIYIALKRSIWGIKLRFGNKIIKWKPSCLGAFSGRPRSFPQEESGQRSAGIGTWMAAPPCLGRTLLTGKSQ